MKKTVFTAIIIVCLLFVLSCKTTGTGTGTTVSMIPTTQIEEAFVEIYEKYTKDIILTGAKTYTVASGDTLYRIARNFYPDGYYYPIIMLASRNVILDPDKITPGMVLTVPDLDRNLANRGARDAMKGVILECAEIERSRNYPGVNTMIALANSL